MPDLHVVGVDVNGGSGYMQIRGSNSDFFWHDLSLRAGQQPFLSG
jgi:hypothetical protein